MGNATRRARWPIACLPTSGVASPETANVVQPSRVVGAFSAARETLRPALAAALSHASVADSVAAAGAAWLPAADEET